uniref:Transmembrane protein 150B n=1 Tax=Seriola lalandi dorsalis TaxID=1841481 RepID=A0A3B4YDS3_SERLL
MWLWALLPVCLAVFGTGGIWTVECGTYNPQSCLFSQICNICSVLALWIVLIRFQQVRDYGNHGNANTAGIVLGFIASVGISVIGNFQQSVLMEIHLLGAFLAFFVGLAFFWIQLFLTYRAQPSQDRCWVGPVRATGCILATILVIVMAILARTGNHSGAAVCEWVLVMLFFCLFGLFAAEFRHIDCHRLTVQKQALRDDCSPATIAVNCYVANALS